MCEFPGMDLEFNRHNFIGGEAVAVVHRARVCIMDAIVREGELLAVTELCHPLVLVFVIHDWD